MSLSPQRKHTFVPSATLALAIAASGFVVPSANAAEVNVIPDTALKACINANLGRAASTPVTKANVAEVKRIDCNSKGVSSLQGLNGANNLRALLVSGSSTSKGSLKDLGPVANLPLLEVIEANGNQISQMPKLSTPKLSRLYLENNQLTEISGVSGAKGLTALGVGYNNVTSLKGVEGLTQLRKLTAYHNQIKNLEPVKSLYSLVDLRVDSNDITNISPLQNLNNLKVLYLANNNDAGARVYTAPKMDISPLKNKPLVYLDIAGNRVADISALSSINSLKYVSVANNWISDLSPLYSSPALRDITLTLSTTNKLEDQASKDYANALYTNSNAVLDGKKLMASPQAPSDENAPRYNKAGETHIDISALKDIAGKSVNVTDARFLGSTPTPSYKVVGNEVVIPAQSASTVRIFYKAGNSSDTAVSYVDAVVTTTAPTPAPTTKFRDVPAGRQFATEINWLATTGITTGYSDGTYRPAATVNRDAMAAFFYRMAGSPAYTAPKVSPFKDVPTTHQFYKEISWLASKGITTGYSDGTFRPGQPINRDAMAAFFYRMDGKPAYTAPKASSFKDVPTTHQFYKEISWFAAQGITKGYSDGTYRPGSSITRDAMAAFIYRYKH